MWYLFFFLVFTLHFTTYIANDYKIIFTVYYDEQLVYDIKNVWCDLGEKKKEKEKFKIYEPSVVSVLKCT